MKYAKVLWKGEPGMIPNCGCAEPGQTIVLPEHMAKDFVKQGKAYMSKPVKPAKEK